MRVCVLQDKTMDTKLSKSPAGSQQSAQSCNALSTTSNNKYTHNHAQYRHTPAYLLHQHKPVDTVHIFTLDKLTHTQICRHREPRHTLRHHYCSAFTAYYLRPITAQQSFVLPLFSRASYLTKRKQIWHSTNG